QPRAVVVVYALDLDVVGIPRLPVYSGAEAVLGVEEFRVKPFSPGGAGNQVQQALEITVERQRQVLKLFCFYLAADGRPVRLKQRDAGDYDGRLIDTARLKLHVGPGIVIHKNVYALADRLLKPSNLDLDSVEATLEVTEYIVTALVCRRRASRIGVHLG